MSFYIRRTRDDRNGWTGPIRSYRQARREFAAWTEAGWDAVIEDSTPEVRTAVRQWQHAMDVKHGRKVAR
jgi:hypothetical protein